MSSSEDGKKDYPVGFGKAPKHTQWQKDQSGNPSGKRKKAETVDMTLKKLAVKEIVANENGVPVTMTQQEAMCANVFMKAMKGDIASAKFITAFLAPVEAGLSGNNIDLLDVYRSRVVYPDLLEAALDLRRKWKPQFIAIELASSGLSLLPDDLRRRGVTETFGVRPGQGKEARMSRQSVLIKSGHVRLPSTASWLEAFLGEVVAFPHGAYDDQADNLPLALYTVSYQNPKLRHCSRYKGGGA